ncbi:hypothetical protein N7509_004541 [Penicillium cosmopolitanum]|uniref:Uncharacterized protein n=1 Tax=Penicillium cosmopolitanum TaxID=1131564 RepID=A0A9W9W0F9_9EURO|nr:uncharacterized protein N7509_004541 [Penicillium cosmopolitanum]KAJ5396428.1 hypothetical protein N7509_004541 [Penicillium cosmopolitanum]
MQLKTGLFLGLATFTALAASSPDDDGEDLEKRQFASGPQCFCCSGPVIPELAGTKCARRSNCATACASDKRPLKCPNGAIFWPPTGASISVLCQKGDQPSAVPVP